VANIFGVVGGRSAQIMCELTYFWVAGGTRIPGSENFHQGREFSFFGPISDKTDDCDKIWVVEASMTCDINIFGWDFRSHLHIRKSRKSLLSLADLLY